MESLRTDGTIFPVTFLRNREFHVTYGKHCRELEIERWPMAYPIIGDWGSVEKRHIITLKNPFSLTHRIIPHFIIINWHSYNLSDGDSEILRTIRKCTGDILDEYTIRLNWGESRITKFTINSK